MEKIVTYSFCEIMKIFTKLFSLNHIYVTGLAAETGISLVPAIFLTEEENIAVPDWLNITVGYSQLPRVILSDYSKKLGRSFTYGFIFSTFTWESSVFLPYFQKKFLEKNGKIVKRNIKNLQELKNYDITVNCTGLGSITVAGNFSTRVYLKLS